MPVLPVGAGGTSQRPSGAAGVDEDGDGEDELLPAMADDDFAAQSSWNSQSKDNLKCAVPPIKKKPHSKLRYQSANGQLQSRTI
jgi:transcription initiation factor TFIID subunit 11